MKRLAFALSVFCLTHFTGWSQSASLNVGSPFAFECEGGAITVTPNVSGFPGPYSFELNFDGLAPNIFGTDADLQPSYTVQASSPGAYEFKLLTSDGITSAEALPVSFEVGATVEGSLSLASLGAGFFEDNISGPTTTFLYCGGVSDVVMDFDVALNGPANSGTAVKIDWGDGSVDNSVGSAVSHNYAPGSWQIAMTVTHPSAILGFPCQQTTVYNVFVGTVPEVSITLAASELCLNNPIAEIVLGNTSLTELTWDINFSDGSNPITFTTSDEVGLIHTFSSSSCGELIETPFGQLNDGFFMTANAQNACGSTPFENVGPFSVSEPPSLQISSDAGSVVCPNQSIAFINNSAEPNWTTGNGCSGDYTYRWEIDSDLTLISGDLGSDNGFPSQPEFWSSGNPEIEVTSSTPGVYQIDLIAFSNSACGVDSASFYLNVEASPVCECDVLLPAISLDDVEVCPGELVPSLELPALDGLTWGWYNDNPTTGLDASGLGDIPAWEALPNTSDTANSGTVTVIGQLPGCFAVEAGSYQISVLAEGCEVGCVSDINNNGVCDDQEVPGCTYAFAQNYNPGATDDDGSCTVAECESTGQDECAVEGDFNGDGIVGTGDLLAFLTLFGSECELECQAGDPCFAYSLTVEASPTANPQLGTTYRFYVNLENETDFVSAVFGNNLSALSVFAPNGVYNDPANTSWSAAGINPAFLSTFPDLAADTYATIGLEGPAYLSGIADAADPSIVSDINQPITPFFTENGATTLLSNTEIGAAWYLLPAGNGSPQGEPWRVLLMQVTTTGSISGQLNYQIFLDGDLTNNISFAASFDGAGVFPSEELIFIEGCMDENACNYDPEANVEPLDACVDPDLNGNCN